jgi:hypothetical protein
MHLPGELRRKRAAPSHTVNTESLLYHQYDFVQPLAQEEDTLTPSLCPFFGKIKPQSPPL